MLMYPLPRWPERRCGVLKAKETMKERHAREIEEMETHAREIERATDYGPGLRCGSGHDSSEFKDVRMEFVKRAEKQFVHQRKREILKLAAAMVRAEIAS